MAGFLPIFPLNIVAFPGERLRLYIFEPRYKQLINECLENDSKFGISPVIDKQVQSFATEMEVISLDKKFDGGEMNITTLGGRRVELDSFLPVAEGKLYPGAYISYSEMYEESPLVLREEVFSLVKKLHAALGIMKELISVPDEISSFQLGHHIGLNLNQEYHLLTLTKESDRLLYIRNHIKGILPIVFETERMKAKSRLNGHYKRLMPPDY